MTKIFLDTNIALEILLKREKYSDCREFLKNQNGKLYISMLSVHIVYYIAIKYIIKKEQIFNFLDQINILELSEIDYQIAKKIIKDNDFEDALQVASAIRNNMDIFLSLDKHLIERYEDRRDMDYVLLR